MRTLLAALVPTILFLFGGCAKPSVRIGDFRFAFDHDRVAGTLSARPTPDLLPPNVTVSVFFHDSAGNLASEYVNNIAGDPHNRDITVAVPRSQDYTVFRAATDFGGLASLCERCGRTDVSFKDGTASTSSPILAAKCPINAAPTYYLEGHTYSAYADVSIVRKSREFCAEAEDVGGRTGKSPILTVIHR